MVEIDYKLRISHVNNIMQTRIWTHLNFDKLSLSSVIQRVIKLSIYHERIYQSLVIWDFFGYYLWNFLLLNLSTVFRDNSHPARG